MDWMTQLAQYIPQTPQEAADKAALQNDVQKYGTAVLERSSPSGSHLLFGDDFRPNDDTSALGVS